MTQYNMYSLREGNRVAVRVSVARQMEERAAVRVGVAK